MSTLYERNTWKVTQDSVTGLINIYFKTRLYVTVSPFVWEYPVMERELRALLITITDNVVLAEHVITNLEF